MFSIKDKVIVVTGGNGLLGSKWFLHFGEHRCNSYCSDIYFEEKLGMIYIIDITDEDSVKELLVAENHNRIDDWVNNAYPGLRLGNKFEDIPLEIMA
jgi:NADP-dependent 3-hydroxy acid dehydrogenase YdfG